MISKDGILDIFRELVFYKELSEENSYAIRAYENALRKLENIEDLEEKIENGDIHKIRGIGDKISSVIEEIYNTGKSEELEELKRHFPESIREMMNIEGLGPKRVKSLFRDYNISSVGELEIACREGRVENFSGFGKKSQTSILKNIRFYRMGSKRVRYDEAIELLTPFLKYLEKEGLKKYEIAGSLRRKSPTVKDADMLMWGEKSGRIADVVKGYGEFSHFVAEGETKLSFVLKNSFHIDIRLVSAKELPHALQHFTGSKEHNVHLRGIAREKGYTMSEYGLKKGEDITYLSDEEDIYKKLGFQYITPELREDSGEFEAAEKNKLPDLIQVEDIRGVFHVHTSWSDGKCDLLQIEKKAKECGFEYVGISDHSSGAFYANGLSEERLRDQIRAVREFDKRSDIRFLIGTECNIKKNGTLDYSDDMLRELDFVIISIHDSLRMPGEAQTERLLKALDNPYVTMLGHPTGRLLLRREPIVMDIDRVLKKCAENDIIIEINSNPMRLDLDYTYVKKAKEMGARFSVNPDSHRVEAFDYIEYGVNTARKGWLEKQDVINTYDIRAIREKILRGGNN